MYAFFPVIWRFGEDQSDGIGGPPVDDAGTIYICHDEEVDDDWPCGGFEASELVMKTTLSECVADVIDGWKEGDGYTGEDCFEASDALAAALRAAADMLDAAKRPSQ